MSNKSWSILAVLVVIGVVAYAFLGEDSTKDKDKGVTPVEVLPAYRTTIFDSVDSLGTTQANESIDITPTVTESIAETRFTDGQEVKKGDVIVLLEQDEEQAQLNAAKARLEENRRELRRIEELLKNKAAARRDYDERLTLIEVAKREVEEAEARIGDRTLRAPFDGVLGIRRLSAGALVQPGQLITTLDDLSRMKLDFAVPSRFLPTLKEGVRITAVSDAHDGKTFEGEVASVNTRVDPITRSVLVRAYLPNEDHTLKPGLLMRVTLMRDEHEGLVVAEESITQRGTRDFLFVVTDAGEVEQREVTLGTRRPGMVEVTEGLQQGEKVITRGVNVVRVGQKVKIAREWETIRKPETGNAGLKTESPVATPEETSSTEKP
ncbi:MAG: efflux RND transporter periplasmic adaptor subunit [Alphaproteobacteria bacterium]|nr:efflux RND transporter periplasmic adaptor subunit [Alphaproteobacteria bacterium]